MYSVPFCNNNLQPLLLFKYASLYSMKCHFVHFLCFLYSILVNVSQFNSALLYFILFYPLLHIINISDPVFYGPDPLEKNEPDSDPIWKFILNSDITFRPDLVNQILHKIRILWTWPDLDLNLLNFQVTGNTPLMYAAMENKINTLERMMELGYEYNTGCPRSLVFFIWQLP